MENYRATKGIMMFLNSNKITRSFKYLSTTKIKNRPRRAKTRPPFPLYIILRRLNPIDFLRGKK
tara:strand:+ start:690 stop:881 length:192 start_codon:yes stop_codon:yes gene_type:complete